MRAVILFLKNYKKTKVKTRLAKDTSEHFAKRFYLFCINKIISTLKKTKIPYFLFWYPEPIIKRQIKSFSQQGIDLGERMFNAFQKIFQMEFKKAIIIGSDIPDISEDIIEKSFLNLENYDYVIGPCLDGGYYLIGTKKENLDFSIFNNISWSTDIVLSQTERRLKEKGFSYSLLKKLVDVDSIEDLKYSENAKNFCNYSCKS